jgi:hypothetical protein
MQTLTQDSTAPQAAAAMRLCLIQLREEAQSKHLEACAFLLSLAILELSDQIDAHRQLAA